MFFKSKTNLLIFAYLSIVFIYTIIFIFFEPSQKVLLTSNELGDFLAGVFAPLAFFYLYLGFKQQGKAINDSNIHISEQLEIQKEMMELQKTERLEREHAVKPILEFYPEILSGNKIINHNEKFIEVPNTKKYRLKLSIKNLGEKITHVSIQCTKPFNKTFEFNRVLDKNDKLITEHFIESNLFPHQSSALSDIDIEIIYTTSIGAKYRSIFEINITNGLDENDIFYSIIANDERIN